jgi:hypothetical protein
MTKLFSLAAEESNQGPGWLNAISPTRRMGYPCVIGGESMGASLKGSQKTERKN